MSSRLPCVLACLVAGLAPAAAAPARNPSVEPVLAGPANVEYTSASPDVSYAFRITNNDATPIAGIQVVARPVLHDGGAQCGAPGDDCTLGWRLGGKPLSLDQPEPLELAAYASAELVLRGKAPRLGTYRAAVVVDFKPSDDANAPLTQAVKLVRDRANLGEKALAFGPGGTRESYWPWPCCKPAPLSLTLANGSAFPVDLGAAPRVQLLRDDGSSAYAHDAGVATAACDTLALPAGAETACSVDLASLPGAGRYRAEAQLATPDIATAKATRDFTVRASWLWALLVLLVSSGFGAAFAHWQNSARRRLLQAGDAQKLKERFAAIDADLVQGAPKAKTHDVIQGILQQLDDIVIELESTATADRAADIDAIRVRLTAIRKIVPLEKAYALVHAPNATLAAAYDAVIAAIGEATLPADFDGKLRTLADEIDKSAGLKFAFAGRGTASPGGSSWTMWSSSALHGLVNRIDGVISVATVLLVAAIGVVTLWVPNPAWGSLGDVVTALVTGFAATATGTTGLRELTNGYVLAKIPAP